MSIVPATPHQFYAVDASGISLAVTEYESAAPDAATVVLVHGIGSRGVSWFPVIDDLAQSHRVITFDLRGHGESAKPERGYLLPDYARDLEGLLTALQPRTATDHRTLARRPDDPPLGGGSPR